MCFYTVLLFSTPDTLLGISAAGNCSLLLSSCCWIGAPSSAGEYLIIGTFHNSVYSWVLSLMLYE